MTDPKDLYLNLMKLVLTNWVYGHTEVAEVPFSKTDSSAESGFMGNPNLQLVRRQPMDPVRRAVGDDWPPTAHTMVGFKRLDNVQHCIEDVLRNDVPGDLIETGVWRGGTAIFMRAILKAHGVADRSIWAADSFKGLPEPDAENYPADVDCNLHTQEILAVPLEEVKANFERYGLLDEQVKFLEGWFKDTLPAAPMEKLAVMRLDGDMYQSTMDALVSLYPKLSVGGYVIIDDFQIEACAQAVHDFRKTQGIEDEIREVDWLASFWQRTQ